MALRAQFARDVVAGASAEVEFECFGGSLKAKGDPRGFETLENGKYYLRDDLSGDIVIKGQVELCLNGHSVTGTGTGSVITVSEGASLRLCDCCSTGCISGGSSTEGGGIYVGENASLTMEGGCVSGNQVIG